jgi:hypothetical protein
MYMVACLKLTRVSFSTRMKTYRYTTRSSLTASRSLRTRRDLLDLDGAYRDRVVVDCCGTLTSQHPTSDLTESTTELESNLAPSDLALSELIGNTIICPVVNNAISQWIMTVLFDTGASLAITPELSDFVSPSKTLARPMKLGGMANGIEIKGIGIIAWLSLKKMELSLKYALIHTMFQKQNRDCYHLIVF